MHLQQAGHRPWVTCWNMCRHRPLIALTAQVCISRGRSPSEVGCKQQDFAWLAVCEGKP